MSGFAEAAARFDADLEFKETEAADLLGGAKLLGHSPTAIDGHDLVQKGIPVVALDHLLDNLVMLERGQLLDGPLGLGLRTLQRYRDAPHKPLGREQSDRVWSFAEVLAQATDVFGSREEAERWLDAPAMALEQRRPLDLLATSAGTTRVTALLTQIDYGVYV